MNSKEKILKSKPSAYRSMRMSQAGLSKPTTKQNEDDLINWKRESWLNLTALITDKKEVPCGTQGKKQKELGLPSVCRASKKVNNKTPSPLADELTKKQILKAIDIKKQGKRIDWTSL
jgi:hypothetical protein